MTETTEAPLSYAQQLLAAFAARDGGGVYGDGFVNWCAHELAGPLRLPDLRRALDALVVRHGALRTVVVRDEGFPYQRVGAPAPVPLSVHEVLTDDADERLAATAEVTAEALTQPLPSDRIPLVAAHLVRFGPIDSALILLIHRTVADGWTMQVAMRDVLAAYERLRSGSDPTGDPVPQYADHALAATMPGREKRLRDAMPYWHERLAGVRRVGIPPDRPRDPRSPAPVKALYTFELDDATVTGLHRRARALRTTDFTLLLTAYAAALASRTGAPRVVVPVLSAGRSASEWDSIGFYLNGHVLPIDLGGDPTGVEAVARVHRANAEALANDVPLIRVLEELPDLAEAAFDARDVVPAPMQLCRPIPRSERAATVTCRRLALPPRIVREEPVMPVDFLWVMEPYTSFVVRVTYQPAMFDEATVAAVAAVFRTALDRIVAAPHEPLPLPSTPAVAR
ncbi:condensation domain-containing protein [Micromonospora zhanjiangensis]|uniref:Condensation domain-containing protein n=1 Tax=Micromonospora zhanjiangensis TaxID=1522057 RepID=A0ABV8KQV8_9ACTN